MERPPPPTPPEDPQDRFPVDHPLPRLEASGAIRWSLGFTWRTKSGLKVRGLIYVRAYTDDFTGLRKDEGIALGGYARTVIESQEPRRE